MAKGFFDNMTGKQKLVLIFGLIVLLIGARVLFPDAAEWFRGWVGEIFVAIGDWFDFGETE